MTCRPMKQRVRVRVRPSGQSRARLPPLGDVQNREYSASLDSPAVPQRAIKAKTAPVLASIRAKTGAVPCFNQLVKAFTVLNIRDFARRRRGYPCLRQDMEAQSGDILGKSAHGIERDLVRVTSDVLALGQDTVGHRDDLATAGLGLVNVDELARGRPQDLAVWLGGGLLDRLPS